MDPGAGGADELSHEIDENLMFIGSDDDVAIRVAGTGVAGKHCQILHAEGAYQIIDLGSPHGTLVNGQKVRQATLSDGDVLVVGSATMTFSTSGASAAAPAAPAAAPSAPVKGRPGARRRSGSRTGSARSRAASAASGSSSRAAAPAPSRARAAAADGGESTRSSRARDMRGKQGMADSTMYAIIGGSVVTLGLLLWWFLSQERQDYAGRYVAFEKAVDEKRYNDAEQTIRRLYQDLPKDHPLWSRVEENYRVYGTATEQQQQNQLAENESAYFGSNVKPYYERYITGKTKARHDPAYARYFVEYRAKPYMERFPGSPNFGQVKMWAETAKQKYDASKPFPSEWWDYEVISQMESRRERYGEAYNVLQEFLQKNPGHQYTKECKSKIDYCVDEVRRKYWGPYLKAKIEENLAATPVKYSRALMWARKAWKNIGDIPDYRQDVSQTVDRIREAAKRDHARIDLSFMNEDPAKLRAES